MLMSSQISNFEKASREQLISVVLSPDYTGYVRNLVDLCICVSI